MNDTILEVKDLSVTFTQYERGFSRRTIHAVEKMDLEIKSGEIVAVVGSSGSGKSLLAHAIMGILPYNRNGRRDMVSWGAAYGKKGQKPPGT